ncbi:MAG: S1 family peptidase [Actinoallomurus sp.]
MVAALVAGFLLVPSAAGATSDATAARVVRALDRSARIPGTAWLADARSNRVTVIADSTVTGAKLQRLNAVTRPYGDAVRLQRVAGTLGVRLSGGDPIFSGDASYRCTAGANVTSGGVYYLITAGHCGEVVASWYTLSGDYIGETVSSSFPGNDYALVRYDGSVSHDGTVGGQDITSAGDAYIGESVCMRGVTSGIRCGEVLALNATVNYGDGTVNGLIETSICTEPGDSGAPLFDGSTLLGTLSGGSGDCASGGISFFQPITPVLSATGTSVY